MQQITELMINQAYEHMLESRPEIDMRSAYYRYAICDFSNRTKKLPNVKGCLKMG